MRLRFNALIGGVVIATVVATAVVSQIWTPFNPLGVNLRQRLNPPSDLYWLGTDEFGRDVASRLMAGAGASVIVALVTVLFAVSLGAILGVVAGYMRGWTDRALMAVNDALLAFPGILLALGIMVVVGANKWGIVLALGLAYAPSVVRVVRGTVLSIREREYVEASRMIGNAEFVSMFRHVLPNCVAPVAVLSTSMFGWVLLSESALSFLGLGVPPPGVSRPGSRVWRGECPRRSESLADWDICAPSDASTYALRGLVPARRGAATTSRRRQCSHDGARSPSPHRARFAHTYQ